MLGFGLGKLRYRTGVRGSGGLPPGLGLGLGKFRYRSGSGGLKILKKTET